jgi:NADH-quinone oxidoreductase subunit H
MLTAVLILIAVVALFPLVAGYIVHVERKVLADIQVRLGPMRVGPYGLMQPLADALKLLLKEDIVPARADRWIFLGAPIVSVLTALTCFAVLPFSRHIVAADVNVGLLVISAMSAVGILGIILGGWASNSHYPLLGALRSAAQLVSYEVALALALLSGVMAAGSLSMVEIVRAQAERQVWFLFANYGFMVVPFVIFLIAATAETNRAPFDMPEAESELVAGFHTEYSGFRWALYMLAEYANIFVVSSVGVTLFLGGWLRPFPNVAWLEIPLGTVFPILAIAGPGLACFPMAKKVPHPVARLGLMGLGGVLILAAIPFGIPAINEHLQGLFWFFFKVALIVYLLIWMRGTFPRLRYDQLMDVGWKSLIPLGLIAIGVNAVLGLVNF